MKETANVVKYHIPNGHQKYDQIFSKIWDRNDAYIFLTKKTHMAQSAFMKTSLVFIFSYPDILPSIQNLPCAVLYKTMLSGGLLTRDDLAAPLSTASCKNTMTIFHNHHLACQHI